MNRGGDRGISDSDGDMDVVVSNCCTDYELGIGEPNSLWINDGNGNFSAGPPLVRPSLDANDR